MDKHQNITNSGEQTPKLQKDTCTKNLQKTQAKEGRAILKTSVLDVTHSALKTSRAAVLSFCGFARIDCVRTESDRIGNRFVQKKRIRSASALWLFRSCFLRGFWLSSAQYHGCSDNDYDCDYSDDYDSCFVWRRGRSCRFR